MFILLFFLMLAANYSLYSSDSAASVAGSSKFPRVFTMHMSLVKGCCDFLTQVQKRKDIPFIINELWRKKYRLILNDVGYPLYAKLIEESARDKKWDSLQLVSEELLENAVAEKIKTCRIIEQVQEMLSSSVPKSVARLPILQQPVPSWESDLFSQIKGKPFFLTFDSGNGLSLDRALFCTIAKNVAASPVFIELTRNSKSSAEKEDCKKVITLQARVNVSTFDTVLQSLWNRKYRDVMGDENVQKYKQFCSTLIHDYPEFAFEIDSTFQAIFCEKFEQEFQIGLDVKIQEFKIEEQKKLDVLKVQEMQLAAREAQSRQDKEKAKQERTARLALQRQEKERLQKEQSLQAEAERIKNEFVAEQEAYRLQQKQDLYLAKLTAFYANQSHLKMVEEKRKKRIIDEQDQEARRVKAQQDQADAERKTALAAAYAANQSYYAQRVAAQNGYRNHLQSVAVTSSSRVKKYQNYQDAVTPVVVPSVQAAVSSATQDLDQAVVQSASFSHQLHPAIVSFGDRSFLGNVFTSSVNPVYEYNSAYQTLPNAQVNDTVYGCNCLACCNVSASNVMSASFNTSLPSYDETMSGFTNNGGIIRFGSFVDNSATVVVGLPLVQQQQYQQLEYQQQSPPVDPQELARRAAARQRFIAAFLDVPRK